MEIANNRLWNRASGSGLQRQGVLAGAGFRNIAKRLIERAALVPIRKLVGVVRASRLAGLASRDEHDGFVPISEISDETHGGAVMFGGGSRAVSGAGLRLVGNAQKSFQQTGAAKWMDHVQSVEAFPSPIVDARFVAHLGHSRYGAIRCRDK